MRHFMKLDVYKLINIILLLTTVSTVIFMYLNYDSWCLGEDISCYYNFYDAIYNPLYSAGKILAVILMVLLIIPSHIFRKWLYYVAPVIILITINRVLAVSVYSSSIGSIDRIHMSQLGMYFLGVVTVIFVAGHLVYDRKKGKSSM